MQSSQTKKNETYLWGPVASRGAVQVGQAGPVAQ